MLAAVRAVGYESPSPIQQAAIPPLLEGRDVLGQAQTGTGKTAAFALPLLCRIDLKRAEPQLLVLTPTRELAIQVAEAMQTYARNLKGFHVLPVYGGTGMDFQLKQLRRGVHAVVGTPGRIQDHLRRKTLKLDKLAAVVIDEADEMLRMGFIEDVESILGEMPEKKQVALFSATLPDRIRKVVAHHLKDPVEVKVKSEDRHGRGGRPAFRRGARFRQARCADAHPRGRGFRRDADLRPHSPSDEPSSASSSRRAAWRVRR